MLGTRCRSCSSQKSLVTSCEIRLLLVAEVARCEKLFVTRCKLCSLLVSEVESLFTTLLKNDCNTGNFSEFLRKFKNTYSVEHLQTTVSENDIKTSTIFYSCYLTSIIFFTLILLSLIELLLNCLIKLN